jgi:hypothetical protein
MAPHRALVVLACVSVASAFVTAPRARVAPLAASKTGAGGEAPPLAGLAAFAALAAPQVAHAEVGLGEEALGVFLGLAPLAAIARRAASRRARRASRPRGISSNRRRR